MSDKSLLAVVACAAVVAVAPAHASDQSTMTPARPPAERPESKLDLTGQKRVGKASFYAGKFNGRRMADGTRMNPQTDNAASKTLPLGTTARVTNLQTGQSATVTIQDRGPYVPGRIVDLSPSTAEKVGIDRHGGRATVEVSPTTCPSRTEARRPLRRHRTFRAAP